MTAALLLSIGLARKLNGECARLDGAVLANDGSKHADCSTCYATCGKSEEMGIADTGFAIVRTQTGLALRWDCPSCGVSVNENTELFKVSNDAKAIAADPLCHKCRAA